MSSKSNPPSPSPVEPEIRDPLTTPVPGALRTSRRLAWLLDDLIPVPGTGFRFGLDPVLGLLPGAGDVLSWFVSLQLIWAGWRMKADPSTLIRMTSHLVLDTVVGAIPLAGNVFDFAYKANDRNLHILESLHRDPDSVRRSSRFWLLTILGGSTALVAGAIWLLFRILFALIGLLPF